MFTNDRSEVPDLFCGAGWRTSGWPLVEVVERGRFVSFVFSRLPQDVYTWKSERKTVLSFIHEARKEVIPNRLPSQTRRLCSDHTGVRRHCVL